MTPRPTFLNLEGSSMTSLKKTAARRIILALTGLLATGASLAEGDLTPALRSSIDALGRLNGQALACQQMVLSTRLRNILIYQAPKERSIGEAFEQATQEAYLAQGQVDKACPDSKTLAAQIETATLELRRSIGRQP